VDALKAIFYVLIVLMMYSYAVYPLLLSLLSALVKKPIRTSETFTPSITLIISAFNEESVIEEKLENALAIEYPPNLLEILVVSDCSTDKTDAIVKSYSNRGVTLLPQLVRKGKTAGLNVAVQQAKGEVLMFSDADSMYERATFRKVADYLSDLSVGLVTGMTTYTVSRDAQITETSGVYTRLERFIKRHESMVGSCIGADGAIFAVRKSLYIPLREDDINDLVIPLNVVRQGHRVVLHPDLHCTETSSPDSSREYERQIRITARTLRALFRYADLLNPVKYSVFSWEIVSHKWLRFSVPWFMLVLLPVSGSLWGEGWVYKAGVLGQIMFYGGALMGYWREMRGLPGGGLHLLYHFVLINMSVLIGWWKYLAGQRVVTWNAR
jgi:cellulose synthase/poly-beta-1,6-N-acetylglucosamine synthase-like glycosyltransferase